MQNGILKGILLLVMVGLVGCGSTRNQPTEAEMEEILAVPSMAEGDERYKIGVGDVLSVSVWGNPELSLAVPVRPDGFISLPLIGDIQADNMDAEGLAGSITSMLGEQLRNPQVTVIVSQVNSRAYVSRVRVTGAVQRPISLPYAQGMSVLDVILEAGGVTDTAAPNRARLYRRMDDKLYDLEVRLDDILLRGELGTNYFLRPGDVITIPERLF